MPTPEIREQANRRLEELYQRHRTLHDDEVVGFYKPELTGAEQDRFGICLATTDGEVYCAGDRPYNPMVNAGALVTTDLIEGADSKEQLERILDTLRRYAGNESLVVDEAVFASEMETTDRNCAISYLMRSYGMIGEDIEATLALYLQQCSVLVTCRDLAVMAATLANGGANPLTGERALAPHYTRDVLSVMHTCGMYDFAGQWAYKIGIPAKSGVSGGILAVVPGKLGIGVFSPGLDLHGNSVRGIAVCEEISERLGLHIFANDAEDALLGPAKLRDSLHTRPGPS